MGELSSLRVTVAGAGVFGLASALELARRGAAVIVCDPRPPGVNASAVAAGMLAPAMEAALDPAMDGRFALLKADRDLWPAFFEDLPGVRLHRDGAVFRGEAGWLERLAAALAGQGSAFESRHGELYTPQDWRLEPRPALAAIRAGLAALGAVFSAERVEAPRGEATVLACGWPPPGLAPELSVLRPIRGQLLRYAGGPLEGPILRSPRAYLAPSAAGAVVGATMDPGRDDLLPDAAASEALGHAAVELSQALAGARFEAEVGVRAATPDGLPLVGASVRPGLWIAAGARRNGWLLAPLVARVLADAMAGREGTEAAALFASGRFRSAGGEEPSPPG
jgi:glycine oxidase